MRGKGKNKKMKTKETVLTKMRKGATFIEYALLAALVAIVVATAALLFGDKLKELFSTTADKTSNVQSQVKEINLTIKPQQNP